MNKVNVTLFYNDSFPKKHKMSNEEAVDLIRTIKEEVQEFTIKEETYNTEDLSSISFSDVKYEGELQGIAFQFGEQ
ncbi:hypothetical protein [Marinilactibacillus sp. Marseille-P9653]|uniref:hypothetical protein n=1 Tax=Marinilactibacillus sp. Marseille-P9653 TaxID=2866583 RepID=UPI001CE478BB|nr:hypothetical protein [Marinilactibacillus sp. Marseille-P9653]